MEKENEIKFENITNEQIYEGIVCLALKLDALLEIFNKVDKLIDKQNEG